MKYKILIILSFFSSGLFAQTSLSLEDALAKGLSNNYSVVSIQKNQDISELNNTWAKAGALPTLDFNANYSYALDDDKTNETTTGLLNSGVNLKWLLFSGFAVRINKHKLAAINELSMGNSAIVIENTIQGIIIYYYTALLESEKLKVSDKLFELSKDRFEKMQLQKDLGSSGTYELLQAKNSFLEDKSKLLLQKSIFNNSLRELNLLMGENSEKKYNLISVFATNSNEYVLANLLDKMTSSNNILKNQYISLKMNELDINLAKSAYYPRLSLSAGASFLNSNTDMGNNITREMEKISLTAGLNLSYNLFNGGNDKRAVRVAKIQKEIGEIAKEEMMLILSNQMASALEMYNVRKEMCILAEENLAAADLNLQMSEERYKSGAISSFNYRDVQIMYMNVAVARLNSIYNLISANTSLVKLTGGLIGE
jgi:outer membrane protein TolC